MHAAPEAEVAAGMRLMGDVGADGERLDMVSGFFERVGVSAIDKLAMAVMREVAVVNVEEAKAVQVVALAGEEGLGESDPN